LPLVGVAQAPPGPLVVPAPDAPVRQPQPSPQPQPKQKSGEVEPGNRLRVETNLVLVDATVKDKSGHVIGDLKKEDFEVYEDGQRQDVSHFSRDELPLGVALVVDLSASIKPFLKPLRYATGTALHALKKEDEVALFTFSSAVERRVELTRDKRAVADQMEFFTAGGSTNINGALYEAADYLRYQAPGSRKVIVLVSDNVPTDKGGVSSESVHDAALEVDAAIYSLRVPGDNPALAKLASIGRGFVNVAKLASETGGEVFDVEQQGSLFLAFQALIERLKTRYTLGYYPAAGAVAEGKFHRLEVRLTAAHGEKGQAYLIVAKQGYFPPRRSRLSP
jgi:Ca-activated chloride channel family protein